ncbi:helix-turn-helix domain-containing protein [Streptomyces griseoaurantiacus]|uniref:Helix-turn-helix domain-containing protein n=1 Tax=Streptomyces griseoaurantiacus TaxID=68213 RepID=A0A1G7GAS6_9ACTN|nr:helix-turn-helix domain-containing protein [Streptomyces jietaisiensis]SDE85220.1 hypothetical protein SAMN05216260_104161 [Streptomyces jietaisiensis]
MAYSQSNGALPARPCPPRLPGAPRAGVVHLRHLHTERYTVVGNHLAQHRELSATAIGLAVHIQSLPDGAPVTVKALAARFSEGETRIARALNELVRAGYLVRTRTRDTTGRIITRTFFKEHPGAGQLTERAPAPPSPPSPPREPRTPTPPPPPPTGPAAELLSRLRLTDHRLLLSTRDVHELVPTVTAWLAQDATPAQITRTLTAGLPPAQVPIHHPSRFLAHRLTTLLPPPLPTTPRGADSSEPSRPVPLINCDGCDRAFRSRDPRAHCGDCRSRQEHPAA